MDFITHDKTNITTVKMQQIHDELKLKYLKYHDPWGFNYQTYLKALQFFNPIYEKYFRVRTFIHPSLQNANQTQFIVFSNHSGQIPLDAILISISFLIHFSPPLVLRGMVERFLAQLPFLGRLSSELGSVLGDRKNCEFLLEKGESILVFPEGVRGISKSTKDFYHIQPFSQGFLRLAIKNKIPLLPVAVIGAEEMFPFVFNASSIAKMLGFPSLPISLNYFPLPSPIDIYIGEPISPPLDLSFDSPDIELKKFLFQLEDQVKALIKIGLENRKVRFKNTFGNLLFNKSPKK